MKALGSLFSVCVCGGVVWYGTFDILPLDSFQILFPRPFPKTLPEYPGATPPAQHTWGSYRWFSLHTLAIQMLIGIFWWQCIHNWKNPMWLENAPSPQMTCSSPNPLNLWSSFIWSVRTLLDDVENKKIKLKLLRASTYSGLWWGANCECDYMCSYNRGADMKRRRWTQRKEGWCEDATEFVSCNYKPWNTKDCQPSLEVERSKEWILSYSSRGKVVLSSPWF